MFDILIVTIINWIMRNIMGQVVRANMSVCYSPTGMFDILIVTIIINWIMKTIMGQVVCATEATGLPTLV